MIICQEIDAEDLETLDALHPANAGERRTLADIIFAKIDSGETTTHASIQKVRQSTCKTRDSFNFRRSLLRLLDREAPDPALGLNPTVVEAYTKCVYHRSPTYKHVNLTALH